MSFYWWRIDALTGFSNLPISALIHATVFVYALVFSFPCSQGQAVRQSGSGGSHGGIAHASPRPKFHLEEIFSIIAGGRTSHSNAGGENLEFSIVPPPASSLCLLNDVSVRRSRLSILFTLRLLLLDLYRLEVITKKVPQDWPWNKTIKEQLRAVLVYMRTCNPL